MIRKQFKYKNKKNCLNLGYKMEIGQLKLKQYKYK